MAKDREKQPPTVHGGIAKFSPLENPLDFIIEDHMREREVCDIIDRLVGACPVPGAKRHLILAFLTDQLPQHLADEEIDLFPMMLKRCDPEEEIKSVIDRLKSDHIHALADAPGIVALIRENDPGSPGYSDSACSQMAEFAEKARRHLTVENAIILPLARAHLTKDDLKTMMSHMLERRGLDGQQECETC